jgi:rubrerythrin
MYTFEDIRDIAVQIEKNGERTYRKAGEKATNEELSKILIWLADEELQHKRWFKALQSQRKITSEHSEMEAMGRALLRDMVNEQPFCLNADRLISAETVSELLTQSLGFEKDTILFYDMLKSLVEDDRSIGQLDQIIAEERGHVKMLEKLQAKFVQGLDVDLSFL